MEGKFIPSITVRYNSGGGVYMTISYTDGYGPLELHQQLALWEKLQ